MAKIILEFDDDDPGDREKIPRALGYYEMYAVITGLDDKMRDADKYGIGPQTYSPDDVRDILRELIKEHGAEKAVWG